MALATFRAVGRLRPVAATNWDCCNYSSVAKGRNVDHIQRQNQRLLRNALREPRLITSIDVAAGRRIRVSSATWEEDWGPGDSWAREIAQLKAAWTAFVAGNFASDLRRDFVRAYFVLLRTCLNGHAGGQNAISVLRKVVGFETIRVSGDCGGLAVAIVSARHPVYPISFLLDHSWPILSA